MQSRYDEIAGLGAEVLAVCVDSPEQNLQVVENAGLAFSILSDADGKMMDAYGLRHAGASMDVATSLDRPCLSWTTRETLPGE